MMKSTPLAKRLTEIRQAFETGSTPDHFVEILNSHVDWLVKNAVDDQALKLGQHVSLELPIHLHEGTTTLGQLKGDGLLVLTWFRGSW